MSTDKRNKLHEIINDSARFAVFGHTILGKEAWSLLESRIAELLLDEETKVPKLESMFVQQREFMELLQKKRNFPEFPVDLSSKEGHKFLKTISYECADELHEARQHLKNKPHRATIVTDVDRGAYIEELCDALHFFIEIVIASGISVDELYDSYMLKGEVNVERIEGGY